MKIEQNKHFKNKNNTELHTYTHKKKNKFN